MAQRTCSIEACDLEHRARGWCYKHWKRWKKHGDPLAEPVPSATQARLRREREEAETGVRKCMTCSQVKPLEDFPPRKKALGGRSSKCRPCRKAVMSTAYQRRKQRDPEGQRRKQRETHLLKYGLTADEYASMITAQRGRCAICGERPPQLLVDHDHELGFVRELLCNPCNLALGFAGDSIQRLEKLTAYLRKHKGRLI
jgi:hypothetical protein